MEGMKYIILVGDGMADRPIESLDGRTVLEAARTPVLDRMAKMGEVGLAETVPHYLPPASDVANMSLMGYDPREYYSGRGPIEAASMGIAMNPEDVAFRCNLVTLVFKNGHIFMKDYSAGHISTEEAGILIQELSQVINNRSFALHAGISYRHLLIWHGGPEGMITLPPHDATGQDITEAWHRYEEEPLLYELLTKATHFLYKHPINQRRREQGKEVANSLWPWGQGRKPEMPLFKEQYGLDGAVVAAVDLIRGLGRLVGMDIVDVEGATGFLDTNYAGKAAAVLETIREKDLVFMHLEAPDEAGHMGSVPEKVRAIERFDKEIVGPVWEGMKAMGVPFRIMVVTDHYTPIQTKTHERGAVPFLIYDSQQLKDVPNQVYTERCAQATGIMVSEGYKLISRFLAKPPEDRPCAA